MIASMFVRSSHTPLHVCTVLASAALLAACEPPRSTSYPPDYEDGYEGAADGGVGVATEELRSGEFSFEDPGVGRLVIGGSACTATLIDPIAVVTAAHCVDYETGSVRGTFTIHVSASTRHVFDVSSARSFGSGLGDDDVAVVRLARAVPSSVATPFGVNRYAAVSMHERVEMYGYGCRSTEGDFASGRKQRLATRFSDDIVSCPGDSGGPVLKTMASGPQVVALVFSGRRRSWHFGWRTEQLHGLVYEHADRIEDQVDDWAGRPRRDRSSGGGGGGGGGGSGRNPPRKQF